jgi:spermidine synthase
VRAEVLGLVRPGASADRSRQLSRRFLFYAIASLSGASALIFENLWFRSSALALGSGAWSSALVLSAFMAGIALGNWLAMRLDARVRRPLRAYAAVELAIGLTGVAALVVLDTLTGLLDPAFRHLDAAWAINVVRVCSAFLVLVIPSAGMGATLPLLMRALAAEPGQFGRWLGTIYGANTAGAVLGVLGCELILLPAVGVYGAGLTAMTLNAAAGFVALRLERRAVPGTKATRKAQANRPLRAVWGLLVASFCSGALFLGFEAVFFRFQLLFFTSLGSTFSVMLAVALAGIAVGGAAAGQWLDRQAQSWLPIASFAAGLALLLSYRAFPAALEPVVRWPPVEGALLTTLVLAFPVACLSGAMFTLLGQAVHAAGYSEANATARLTIANTIGGAAGSVLTGFSLIGAIGLEACFRALILGYIGVGVWLAVVVGRAAPRRAGSLAAGAAVLLMSVALFPAGVMRDVYQRLPIDTLTAAGERRVAFREGQLETLQFLQADLLGEPEYYRMVVNNHSMSASEVRSRRYMRLLAYMPGILHPGPRKAALLGLGLGVTAKGLTDDDRLEVIDVVDISRDIPAMLPTVYPAPGESPLDDPRVRLHIEDGRFFLQTSRSGYDVITGEPPPPHFAGVAGLYSQEFFELVRQRLNPGGIVSYWLPVHDLKVAEAQAITRAFLDVFPDASLWSGAGFDWILIATKPPVRTVTTAQMGRWWTRAPSADRLREIGVDDPETLGALFLADGARLRGWATGAPALTDNFPKRISLASPRDEEDTRAFLAILNTPGAVVNFASSPSIGALWPNDLRARTGAAAFERQSRLNTILSLPTMTVQDVQALLGDGRPDPLLVKALFWRHAFDFDRARTLLARNPQLVGDDVAEYRAELDMMEGRFKEAADRLARVGAHRAPRVRTIRMFCLLRAGQQPSGEAGQR